MSGSIFLFRHVPDSHRGETRNVGVALLDDNVLDAMFLGEIEPGEVDGRKVLHHVSDPATYGDWVHYWRHHLERGQDGLQNLLDERMQRPDFSVEPAGEIIVDDPAQRLYTVEHLFSTLVERTGISTEVAAARRINAAAFDLLKAAGIDKRSGFKRQIVVRDQQQPTITYRFPFGVRQDRLTVGATVNLDNTARVEQMCFRFGHVPDRVRRICLVRGRAEADGRLEYLRRVTDDLVDMDGEDAIDRVREAFPAA